MFDPIKDIIRTKLQAITSIQEVGDFPNEEFGGYPGAMIASTRSDSDFTTTKENRRMYVFTIYLLHDIQIAGGRQSRLIIESVVDDVLDAFDHDQLLSGISLPAGETMIISYPTLSQIYVSENGKYTVGEVEVRVYTQFTA